MDRFDDLEGWREDFVNAYAPRSERIKQQKEGRGLGSKKAWDWVQAIGIALILSIVIRFFVFEPFNVSGPSMERTMYTGNLVLVNKFIYHLRDPKPGEIIVFHTFQQKDYIKRIVGVAGDKVEAVDNRLLINEKVVEEPYINQGMITRDFDKVIVPPGHVFVLGDNRLNSEDSRSPLIGPVPLKQIVGRADLIYWPIQKINFFGFN
jgi:signal peptidase I